MPGFAERLLASFGSAVLAVDTAGRIVEANAEARRLLALPADASLRGCGCRELLGREPGLVALLLGAAQGRRVLSRAELRLEGRGPEAAIGLSLFPVRDAAGELLGAAAVFRDLAPIERGEEQERLRSRLAALGEMAAGLAHELRNPLASMEVLAGLLQRRLGSEPPEARELADELLGQVRALSKIVAGGLDFLAPAAPRRRDCEPVALLESAIERTRPRLRAEAVAVERRYGRELPPVAVEEEAVVAALANLVANACDALAGRSDPRRLALRVDLETPGTPAAPREVVIAIADNGPGVPRELREKVFYPFFTTREGGSGIGLATAQKAVAAHGGAIELTATRGGGATFRVRLPAVAAKPAREPR